MAITQVYFVLGTIKAHSKMCSFVTQHNATDVSSFEGVCNWQKFHYALRRTIKQAKR